MPQRDTSFHSRLLAAQMEDPEFREEYNRARAEIAQVDAVIRQLDELREEAGISKAELARRVGRNPSSIRRLFTAAWRSRWFPLLACSAFGYVVLFVHLARLA